MHAVSQLFVIDLSVLLDDNDVAPHDPLEDDDSIPEQRRSGAELDLAQWRQRSVTRAMRSRTTSASEPEPLTAACNVLCVCACRVSALCLAFPCVFVVATHHLLLLPDDHAGLRAVEDRVRQALSNPMADHEGGIRFGFPQNRMRMIRQVLQDAENKAVEREKQRITRKLDAIDDEIAQLRMQGVSQQRTIAQRERERTDLEQVRTARPQHPKQERDDGESLMRALCCVGVCLCQRVPGVLSVASELWSVRPWLWVIPASDSSLLQSMLHEGVNLAVARWALWRRDSAVSQRPMDFDHSFPNAPPITRTQMERALQAVGVPVSEVEERNPPAEPPPAEPPVATFPRRLQWPSRRLQLLRPAARLTVRTTRQRLARRAVTAFHLLHRAATRRSAHAKAQGRISVCCTRVAHLSPLLCCARIDMPLHRLRPLQQG